MNNWNRKLPQSKADLEEVEAQLLKLEQQSLREISDLERQLVEVGDIITKERLDAPVAGIIYGMVPSSPGYAATAGETLVKVVPGGEIEPKYLSRIGTLAFLNLA